MSYKEDLLLFSALLLIISGAVYVTGTVKLPGTQNVQLPDFDNDKPSQNRYKVNTEVTIDYGTLTGFQVKTGSFSYGTSECGVLNCGLSFAGTPQPLAFFGVDNVKADVKLMRGNVVVAQVKDKKLGELGALNTKKVSQSFSNIPSGDYTVRYHFTYYCSLCQSIKGKLSKTSEFQISVPDNGAR